MGDSDEAAEENYRAGLNHNENPCPKREAAVAAGRDGSMVIWSDDFKYVVVDNPLAQEQRDAA